ncbi:hypothetical protein [Streptomyces glycanivorans]|uniref:Uncharacterized protein n=1 Tax=Streptomyces glycanivorans TaxID=3033808 RepID=A0ABY9JQE8_9ACTN|nr:hypothetical protein [Streptomyces sp. Alt3]WLQ69325.1 hypothetical protein P8A20_38065 [Streptomyces sp. Alt3]
MPEFPELIPLVLQMLPHMLVLLDRPAFRRSRHHGARPPAGPVTVPTAAGNSALLELMRGMPPGTVLRYEAPDGTVLTCWSAPGTEHGEYRLW